MVVVSGPGPRAGPGSISPEDRFRSLREQGAEDGALWTRDRKAPLSGGRANEREGKDHLRFTLRNESGYSLIEILVSVIVFSIAIVFVFQMLWSGQTTVQMEGERRVALRMAELKLEELKYAGYASSGSDTDWTSLNMDSGTHPSDPTVTLDGRATDDTGDDLVGSLQWAVRETTWSIGGVTTRAKIVNVEVEWPQGSPRDRVDLTSLVGE
ncbi:MAG: prepilin-type N-terminal cleavage/methylation domain-containing protein [Candidatus Eisenbacteria bacterium]|nr:prepilin-type N-terminal cleavage/methylation domain-containing protein [Candidatus Eisenbacteria bacterium]